MTKSKRPKTDADAENLEASAQNAFEDAQERIAEFVKEKPVAAMLIALIAGIVFVRIAL